MERWTEWTLAEALETQAVEYGGGLLDAAGVAAMMADENHAVPRAMMAVELAARHGISMATSPDRETWGAVSSLLVVWHKLDVEEAQRQTDRLVGLGWV